MPVITPQARPGAATEESYRAPKKTIQASPTGMNIESPKQPKTGQVDIGEEDKKPQADTLTLSPQVTALARKEQKFRQQEQALKTKEKEFEAKLAAVAKYEALQKRLAEKDFSALEEMGISYDEYTNYQINKGTSESPEAQRIKQLETKLNSLETQTKENVDKQYEATVNQYRKEITDLVSKNAAYESIKERKAEEHVLQHILDTFEQDGEVLTVEEAAKEVEDALLEEALEWAKLKKVQEKLAPEKATLPPPQKKTGLRTLTQEVAPTSATRTLTAQFQHLSPRERLAQAVARASGKQQ